MMYVSLGCPLCSEQRPAKLYPFEWTLINAILAKEWKINKPNKTIPYHPLPQKAELVEHFKLCTIMDLSPLALVTRSIERKKLGCTDYGCEDGDTSRKVEGCSPRKCCITSGLP